MTPRPKQQESKIWIVRLFKTMNSNWASRIFSIIVLGLIVSGYFFYLTSKATSKEDCTKCESEKKLLVDLMLEIKKDMVKLAGNDISSNLKFNSGIAIAFPFIDTLPKKRAKDSAKRKTTVPSLQQQQMQVATKVILKIDSVLRQVQQQQKQTKN